MSLISFIYMTIIVIAVWALSGVALYNSQERGTFGDMFGAINALFSGLAFAGLIYTILLQRQELSLTRDELHGQRKELESQARELTIQNFENKFFHLMNLHIDTLNSIDITNKEGVLKGRDAFVEFYERLQFTYRTRIRSNPTSSNSSILFHVKSDKEVIEEFFTYNIHELGHYFKTFKNIVSFITNSTIRDQLFYIDVLKSQLSQQELLLLMYNSFSDVELKKLLIENSFIDDSVKDYLLDNTHYDIYNNSL